MSVFQVRLNNINQGYLDINPNTVNVNTGQGQEMQPSIQRTMFVQGPSGTFLKLHDGDIFTACNYWKRFAFPNVSLEDAIVNVLVDDNVPYSTAVAFSDSSAPYAAVVPVGTTVYFGTSDFAAPSSANVSTGTVATQLTLVNNSGVAATVTLNGSASAVLSLAAGEMITFAHNEFAVSTLAVAGGAVNVVAGLQTSCAVGYSNICPYVATAMGYVDPLTGLPSYNVCP
jgi:hypothetical protein